MGLIHPQKQNHTNKKRKEAEVTMEGHFLVRQIYDDEVTYNIVGAAERVLSKSLKNFGF